jgi:RES domain-containing protein
MPRVIVASEANLERVLDLGNGHVRRVLVVSMKRMLSEPWREEQQKGREALTQAVGRLAYELDIQALVVPSAARKGGSNLIVFPANLDPPKTWLRIVNRDELPREKSELQHAKLHVVSLAFLPPTADNRLRRKQPWRRNLRGR